jgi:hypothetical protein
MQRLDWVLFARWQMSEKPLNPLFVMFWKNAENLSLNLLVFSSSWIMPAKMELLTSCAIYRNNAGYSHQPSDIPKFFKTMIQDYDGVFGSRFCRNGKMTDCAKSRYITSLGGTIVSNLLLGTKLSDMTSGFELFKCEVLQNILDKGILARGPFFQTEIRAYSHQFRITEVPIHYKEASHNIGGADLCDSFSNLWRLFCIRLNLLSHFLCKRTMKPGLRQIQIVPVDFVKN